MANEMKSPSMGGMLEYVKNRDRSGGGTPPEKPQPRMVNLSVISPWAWEPC